MSDQVLTEISQKLDQLVSLVAASTVKGMKQSEAILFLGAAGLDRNLIAQILGTTPGTVSVRLSQAKSSKTAPEKKKKAGVPAVSPSSEEKA